MADTTIEDAQSQVPMAEYMHLTSSHANLRLEHSNTLARLRSLQSAFESAEAQRSADVAELEELRSQLFGMERLQSDHQELKDEHTALADNHEQISEQYGQQWHQGLALQDERRLQLKEAEEVRAQNLAEQEDLREKFGTDLDRLQAEVLSLQDRLDIVTAQLERKAEQEKHFQQQFGRCLEHNDKANTRLSECNIRLEARLQEQQAAKEQLVTGNVELQQKLVLSEDNAMTWQQGHTDCSSNLTRALDRLEASELRCSELEQDLVQSRASSSDAQSQLATLQADLKKLHDLTAGGRLTAENLFHMFAKPVSSENSAHSLEESVAPPATASTAAATAARDSSHTDQTPCKGDHLFRDDPKESADSQTAGASGGAAFVKGTSEASAHAFDSTIDIAANSSHMHGQYGTGHDRAAGAEPKGKSPAGKPLVITAFQ